MQEGIFNYKRETKNVMYRYHKDFDKHKNFIYDATPTAYVPLETFKKFSYLHT